VGTGWTDPIPTLYGFGVNRLIRLRLLYKWPQNART